MRPQTYAPIIAAAFVLWILVSFLGGQGFTPLLGVIGIAALFFHRPARPLPPYVWLSGAAVLWACLTAAWSPASEGIVTGSVVDGDFSINAAGLRIFGTFALGGAAILSALSIPQGKSEKSGKVMLGAIAVQGALVVILFLCLQQILELVYPGDPYRQLSEGRQNAMRMANAYALALSIGLAAAWYMREDRVWRGGIAIATLIFLAIFQSIGSQSAVLSMVFVMAAYAGLQTVPKTGFKWLMRGIAGYVAGAPIIFGTIGYIAGSLGLTLPGSFQSRLYAWRFTVDKITDRPFTGHGLEASSKWTDTFSSRPDWLAELLAHQGVEKINIAPWETFRIVPGHPHNMPLQIWAETGLIGALLTAGVLLLIGERLPSPKDLRIDVRLAAAGVIAAVLPMVSFAYSVWNEAFWSMVVIAICGVILLARMTPWRLK